MTIDWHHVPEQPDKMLPEQWFARVADKTVAAVLRDGPLGAWQAIMTWPDGAVASLHLSPMSLRSAQREVEMSLRDMGWR